MEKMIPQLAAKYSCTGCMVCVDACKSSALEGEWAEDGHLYVKRNLSNCTGCGRCETICPVAGNFSYERDCNRRSVPFVAWARDDAIRKNSSSGGLFAPIAYRTIKNGGYVAGAIMDGVEVMHILTNNLDDVVRMQGSKYQQGDLTGIYSAVKEKIKQGTSVFFTGVPCQVAALYSFLGKYGQSGLLLTADVLCSGFPTIHLLKRFARENFSKSSIEAHKKIKFSYRSKEEGWANSQKIVATYSPDGQDYEKSSVKKHVDFGFDNIVYNGFLNGLTQRYSCGNCQFTFMHRKADLTMADFWNEKHFPEEHEKGVSCVIVHSEAGGKVVANEELFIVHPTAWSDFVPYNKLIYHRLPLLRFHPARILLAWNFKNLSYPVLEKIYGKKLSKMDIAWLPYRTLNYIYRRIRITKRQRYISNFMNRIRT
jgi:ferredoxin